MIVHIKKNPISNFILICFLKVCNLQVYNIKKSYNTIIATAYSLYFYNISINWQQLNGTNSLNSSINSLTSALLYSHGLFHVRNQIVI